MRRLSMALQVLVLGAACSVGEPPRVAFLGDSLTDGWGLSRDLAYPALLGQRLAVDGHPIRVLNAGRGGDTVAQGLARLDDVLRREPQILVVALGINDALRGLPVADAERDLRQIIARAREQRTRVILVGAVVPESLATPHSQRFAAMYAQLASDMEVAFVPDLLAGASGDPALMFPDALHPNALGQRRLADNVRPMLECEIALLTATVMPAPALPGCAREARRTIQAP